MVLATVGVTSLGEATPSGAGMPADLAERPRDPARGVPVPFVCGDERLGPPLKSRVVQCALSRICPLCARSMSWGQTFLGSEEEADEGGFHFPPMHPDCAEVALRLHAPLPEPALGQSRPLSTWVRVVTGGFELVRPASRGGDMRMVFRPNSVTEQHRHHVPGPEAD